MTSLFALSSGATVTSLAALARTSEAVQDVTIVHTHRRHAANIVVFTAVIVE